MFLGLGRYDGLSKEAALALFGKDLHFDLGLNQSAGKCYQIVETSAWCILASYETSGKHSTSQHWVLYWRDEKQIRTEYWERWWKQNAAMAVNLWKVGGGMIEEDGAMAWSYLTFENTLKQINKTSDDIEKAQQWLYANKIITDDDVNLWKHIESIDTLFNLQFKSPMNPDIDELKCLIKQNKSLISALERTKTLLTLQSLKASQNEKQ